jgi:hypothetical protein
MRRCSMSGGRLAADALDPILACSLFGSRLPPGHTSGTTPTSTHVDAPAHVFINFAPQACRPHWHTVVIFINIASDEEHGSHRHITVVFIDLYSNTDG